MIRFLVLLAVLATRVAGGFESVEDPRPWAMTGLTIIDVATGEVARDQTILIRSGVIEAVGDDGAVLPESDVLRLDYEGRYAVPGLWDMHVHLRGGPALIDANEVSLRQYLGFGVTGVRDAGGDLPNAVLRWRDEISRGERFGPRIFTSLRKLDGPGRRQPGSIPIASAEAVDTALDDLVAAGADFIKLYELSIPPELFSAALRKAEARGLETAAHVPLYVPFRDLVDAGLDSVEHVFFFMKAANPNDRARSLEATRITLSDVTAYFEQYTDFADGADESYARQTFHRMARHGTAITPTLAIEMAGHAFLHGEPVETPRAEQTPAAIRERQALSVEGYERAAEALRPSVDKFVAHTARFLGIAAEEGVTVLAGSDTGTGNPWLYAGDSLHVELEELVAFGLSPLQALKSATVDAARWMGREETLGAIRPGFAADIVVLEANPLEDIENTRSIEAVVQQGVHFDAAELGALKRLGGRLAGRDE